MSRACAECGGSGLQDVSGFGHFEACEDCKGVGAVAPSLAAGTIYQHKKRGTLYRVLGTGTMQATGNPLDCEKVVIYQGVEDQTLWSRPVAQFLDGRFEKIGVSTEDANELREDVRRMIAALSSREWAEHSSRDIDVLALETEITRIVGEHARLHALINTPELASFRDAVVLEAAHQRERWGSQHDAGKSVFDWVFLIGHLATRAAQHHQNGNLEKALHHAITTAAVCANWHAHMAGHNTAMRPGIAAAPPGINGGDDA